MQPTGNPFVGLADTTYLPLMRRYRSVPSGEGKSCVEIAELFIHV